MVIWMKSRTRCSYTTIEQCFDDVLQMQGFPWLFGKALHRHYLGLAYTRPEDESRFGAFAENQTRSVLENRSRCSKVD